MAVESLVEEAKTHHSPSLHIEVTNGYTANAEPSVKEAILHPLSAYNHELDEYTEAVKQSAVATDRHFPSLTDNMPALPIQTQAIQGKLVSSDDFEALVQLCNETEWTEGLWLHCHSYCGINQTSICGGLNNARNRIQICLRLAIDGGMGMILPSATMRDEANLVHTDGGMNACAEKFWDTPHLQTALGEQCPQLQIRSCDDRSGIDAVLEAPGRSYLEPSYTNGTFRLLINDVLEAAALNFTDVTPSNPLLITFGDTYVGWNYRLSFKLSTIRKALFRTLKFNERLLNLGSKILRSPELQAGSFIGVHLRGENDWPAGFGGVNDQMNLYVEAIENIHNTSAAGVKVVYLSCGDPAAIGLFRDMLSPLGYTVHDKWTLLADQPDTLARIEGLGFDEKAIMEYHTLVEATFWMGIITSSMSSLIAYARSVNEKGDFFETHIFPSSEKSGFDRHYPASPAMRGSNVTKLMVLSGPDIMDSFP